MFHVPKVLPGSPLHAKLCLDVALDGMRIFLCCVVGSFVCTNIIFGVDAGIIIVSVFDYQAHQELTLFDIVTPEWHVSEYWYLAWSYRYWYTAAQGCSALSALQ